MQRNKRKTLPQPHHRREWGFAPLCGAGTTFSGSSKDPSRPCREGRIILICLSNFYLICIIYLLNVTTPRPTREGLGEGLLGEGLLGEGL